MKQKITAVVLLLIVIGFVAVNTIIIDKQIENITEQICAIDIRSSAAKDKASEIYERFKKMESFISLTVNHDDLTNIDDCFVGMIGYLSVGDVDESRVTKDRLTSSLEHLRRLSTFTFDAII